MDACIFSHLGLKQRSGNPQLGDTFKRLKENQKTLDFFFPPSFYMDMKVKRSYIVAGFAV